MSKYKTILTPRWEQAIAELKTNSYTKEEFERHKSNKGGDDDFDSITYGNSEIIILLGGELEKQ